MEIQNGIEFIAMVNDATKAKRGVGLKKKVAQVDEFHQDDDFDEDNSYVAKEGKEERDFDILDEEDCNKKEHKKGKSLENQI